MMILKPGTLPTARRLLLLAPSLIKNLPGVFQIVFSSITAVRGYTWNLLRQFNSWESLSLTTAWHVAQGQNIHLVHFSSRNSPGYPKKRDITFKFRSFLNFAKSSKNSTRLFKWKNHQGDSSVKGHTIKTLVKQKKTHFSLFFNLIRETKS